MPGKVKVRILSGRNLPVMDRSSDTTDAYVEVKLANITFKTDVFRKSLNPQWNSEWFIFEVDDLELQDEPLQIRLMDHDTYSTNDAIGKVYLDLNPLLLPCAHHSQGKNLQDVTVSSGAAVMSGWFPVYDTMHGIRGEVNVLVKVDLFSDFNKFRQSSCGVQFFFTQGIPCGFRCNSIIGFVEELVVNDDPEYKWIDKIRTPRASNEARQTLFWTLSGELQRRIGLKVLEQGGNAVIGYRQCFDLEGEYGIVVRGIGSVVNLTRALCDNPVGGTLAQWPTMLQEIGSEQRDGGYSVPRSPQLPQEGPETYSRPTEASSSPTQIASPSRGVFISRSSDSDSPITPKGGSIPESGGSSGGRAGVHNFMGYFHRPLMSQESFDNLIYPFVTMKSFPPGFIIHLGGTVCSRSVQLLDRGHLPEEVQTRDSWWSDLRTEIRAHARSLGCNVVIGYEEFTSISEDVCLLNAVGTAAVINVHYEDLEALSRISQKGYKDSSSAQVEKKESDSSQPHLSTSSGKSRDSQPSVSRSHPSVLEDEISGSGPFGVMLKSTSSFHQYPPCSMCHIPHVEEAKSMKMTIVKCAICRKRKVPDILLTTIEIPPNLPVGGVGCLIEARVIRVKKDLKGEANAREMSDAMPFLEYDLHKQLYQKLMIKGLNAIFALRIRVTIGEKFIVGVGTGTGVYLKALPAPAMPRVISRMPGDEERKAAMQKRIQVAFEKNKEFYGLNSIWSRGVPSNDGKVSDSEDSDEDAAEVDVSSGNKDMYHLDLNDLEDVEMLNLLLDEGTEAIPNRNIAVTTQLPPGVIPDQISIVQMLTRVWRTKLAPVPNRIAFSSYFDYILKSIFFKLRNLYPCVLCGLQVNVELPEEDEVQISVCGMVMSRTSSLLASPPTGEKDSLEAEKPKQDSSGDLMFRMEEIGQSEEGCQKATQPSSLIKKSPSFLPEVFQFPSAPSAVFFTSRHKYKNEPANSYPSKSAERFGVEITSLSFIPGSRIEKMLGNLNFFFIRESTNIKESGGLNSLMGSFITEVLALVRAHVAAVGGNALISYFLSECALLHNPHKSQGQCLINVGGDIAYAQYINSSSVRVDGEQTEASLSCDTVE